MLACLAMYETFTNFDLGLPNIFNILLSVLLLVQILTNIIIYFIAYYIDYLLKCIEQDIKQSGLIQIFSKFNVKKQVKNYLVLNMF